MKSKLLSVTNELSKIKSSVRYVVLVFVLFIAYYFFRLYCAEILESVAMDPSFVQIVAENNSVVIFLFAILAILVLLLSSFIWDHCVSKKAYITDDLNAICKECVQGKIARELSLGTYGLCTISELLQIEKSLTVDDEVIIYTSLAGSESDVLELVKSNREKGVIYHLLFYSNYDGIASEWYNSFINLCELGYKQGIDFKLSENTGFDVFTFKRKQSKLAEAYFAINFSVGAHSCVRNELKYCDNPCDKENNYLFYKKIDEKVGNAIFEKLKEIVKTHENAKRKVG